MCPHCGPHGQVEQIGFGSEYETFYCNVCKKKYVAFPIGGGELSELVPYPQPQTHHYPHYHAEGNASSAHHPT